MESNQNKQEYFGYQEITEQTIKALSLRVQEVKFFWLKIGGGKWGPVMEALSQKQQLSTLIIDQCSTPFSEEQITHLSLLKKLSKLHLEGRFEKGNWFSHICSMTSLKQLTLIGDGFNLFSITQLQFIQKLTNLTKLTLNKFKINFKDAQTISDLACLTELNLNYNRVGDEGCSKITKMKNLIILSLDNNGISNAGVGFLSQLVNVQQLNLDRNNIDSVGVAHLTKLTNLKILSLKDGNNIGDDGTKRLSTMQSLRQLYLWQNNIGDEGLLTLCRLTNLEEIQLGQNNIRNEGICEVRKLTKLKQANFYNYNVDSNGAFFIERMNNLKKIYFGSNKFHSTEIDKIKRRFPKMNIYV